MAGRSWESNYRLRIGRLNKFDIILTDTSVSRQHAEVIFTAAGWAVRDLGSTNGTFVNGQRVSRAEEKIRAHDILQFGEICFRVAEIAHVPGATLTGANGALWVAGTAYQSFDDVVELASRSKTCPSGKSRAEALLQAGRQAYHCDSLPRHAESLLWEVAEELNALPCGVWLRDEPTGFLVRQAGLEGETQPWQTDGGAEQLARFALDQGESVLFHGSTGIAAAGRSPGAGYGVLCAVLRSPSGLFGVLQLASALGSRAPFDRTDLELADALALLVGPGLDHMRQVFQREQGLLLESIATLGQLLDLRDDLTGSQSQRVTDYALRLAEELQLPEQDRCHLRLGGPLYNLSRIGIKEAILQKPGALEPHEMEHIRSSVARTANLLEANPVLLPLLPIVRSHREHWDGSGYPDGLAGEQIPQLGRVVGLAAAFDAMTSDRPYRKARSVDQAFAEIAARSGSQFDPKCVAAWLRLRPQIEDLFRERALCTKTISREVLERIRKAVAAQAPASPTAVKPPVLVP
jgi:HD-GYP domain-containing protein (c-di-GMP phosphodiesterase class II)